jgi:hypothetical protein
MFAKNRLDFIVEYGEPILQASGKIIEMIKHTNIYGVESLSKLVQKETEKQLKKITDNKIIEGKGK